jgi:transposase
MARKKLHIVQLKEKSKRKKSMNQKNELEIAPLRMQKIGRLLGLLFIFFVSLILRALLLQKASDTEILDENSIEDLLMKLSKLRAVKVGGKMETNWIIQIQSKLSWLIKRRSLG